MHKSDFPIDNKKRPFYDARTVKGDVDTDHIDNESIDIITPNDVDFPIVESLNNAIIWPEEIKGGIDLTNTYEITSVPKDPDTPLESYELLQNKGIFPK